MHLKYCLLLLFYIGFSEGMLEKYTEMVRNNTQCSDKSGLSSKEKNRAKLCVIYIFLVLNLFKNRRTKL